MMWDKCSSDTASHRLCLVDLNCLAMGRIAVNWKMTGLTCCVTTVYQKLLGRRWNEVALDTLGVGKMGLRLFCYAVTQRIPIFCVIEFLNGHISVCRSGDNSRLRLGIMTNNNLFLFTNLFPRW